MAGARATGEGAPTTRAGGGAGAGRARETGTEAAETVGVGAVATSVAMNGLGIEGTVKGRRMTDREAGRTGTGIGITGMGVGGTSAVMTKTLADGGIGRKIKTEIDPTTEISLKMAGDRRIRGGALGPATEIEIEIAPATAIGPERGRAPDGNATAAIAARTAVEGSAPCPTTVGVGAGSTGVGVRERMTARIAATMMILRAIARTARRADVATAGIAREIAGGKTSLERRAGPGVGPRSLRRRRQRRP